MTGHHPGPDRELEEILARIRALESADARVAALSAELSNLDARRVVLAGTLAGALATIRGR